jgi:hypothetical protein
MLFTNGTPAALALVHGIVVGIGHAVMIFQVCVSCAFGV